MGGIDPEDVICFYNSTQNHAIYVVAPETEFNYSQKWMVHEKHEVLDNDFEHLPDTIEQVIRKKGMGELTRHLAQHFLPIREEMIYTQYRKSRDSALLHVFEVYGLDYSKMSERG